VKKKFIEEFRKATNERYGTFIFSNGDVYEGYYENGFFHGKGK
jgi:hypothetical protein